MARAEDINDGGKERKQRRKKAGHGKLNDG